VITGRDFRTAIAVGPPFRLRVKLRRTTEAWADVLGAGAPRFNANYRP
jgi:hypothetical protein